MSIDVDAPRSVPRAAEAPGRPPLPVTAYFEAVWLPALPENLVFTGVAVGVYAVLTSLIPGVMGGLLVLLPWALGMWLMLASCEMAVDAGMTGRRDLGRFNADMNGGGVGWVGLGALVPLLFGAAPGLIWFAASSLFDAASVVGNALTLRERISEAGMGWLGWATSIWVAVVVPMACVMWAADGTVGSLFVGLGNIVRCLPRYAPVLLVTVPAAAASRAVQAWAAEGTGVGPDFAATIICGYLSLVMFLASGRVGPVCGLSEPEIETEAPPPPNGGLRRQEPEDPRW